MFYEDGQIFWLIAVIPSELVKAHSFKLADT